VNGVNSSWNPVSFQVDNVLPYPLDPLPLKGKRKYLFKGDYALQGESSG
jgi:hypothetical protein